MIENKFTQSNAVLPWYVRNPHFREIEIDSVRSLCPSAQMGFLIDNRMYWIIKTKLFVDGNIWTLKIIYDQDHPQYKVGGSIRTYLVEPCYSELMKLIERNGLIPQCVPHCINDKEGLWLDTTFELGRFPFPQPMIVESATSIIPFAFRWIGIFELGLNNQEIWTLFSGVPGEG